MYSEFASILHLILLLHIQGSLGLTHWTVRCEKESICALRGSEVYLSCSYSHSNIQTVMWFSPKQKAQWRSEDRPEDLALDSDYAGRVDYIETTNSTCRLRIRDVRERDSGEYRLMLFTTNNQTYLSSTAVNMTVTDIQVKTHPGSMQRKEQPVNLICHTSCKLNNFWCIWNKNGQRVHMTSYQNSEPLVLSSSDGGSYSCSIKDYGKTVYSPAVCVLGKNCLDVTYTDRRVCALEGSTVDIPCTFSYPSDQTVIETYWSYNQIDMKHLKQFTDRIEYIGDHKKSCTLRLTSLKQSDSGNYQFNTASRVFRDYPGVQLTVTGVRVHAVTLSGQTVVLTCRTTCSLSEDKTYIWYKNGLPITDKFTKYNKLYLDLPSYKKTDNYTCAVKGAKADNILKGEWWTHTAVGAAVGGIAILLLLLLFAVLYIRRTRGEKTGARIQTCPEDDTYTAINPLTNSSDCYGLRTRMVPANNMYINMNPAVLSASDTGVYTALQKRDPESVYETMQRKDPA